MIKNKKRLLAFFVAVVMALSVMPRGLDKAFAYEEKSTKEDSIVEDKEKNNIEKDENYIDVDLATPSAPEQTEYETEVSDVTIESIFISQNLQLKNVLKKKIQINSTEYILTLIRLLWIFRVASFLLFQSMRISLLKILRLYRKYAECI